MHIIHYLFVSLSLCWLLWRENHYDVKSVKGNVYKKAIPLFDHYGIALSIFFLSNLSVLIYSVSCRSG